ncbi:ATP synthase subunit I [Psychromonas sp. RZ22]|uniref:ATP synthase subunit I n=1 Tax=Psychromonas algarum TaxID=2555643 RepID=UPI001067252E|nr:ATP synthase subunit I [Psychromonas sp. RZ22]TEW53217.1 ATP synthase subunit I [Psychromonas sp. RZ22]
MSDDNKYDYKNLFIIFIVQSIFVGIFALFFYLTKGETAGMSAVLGGLVYCVPALFASLFMSRASNASATLILAKAYLGTFYKIIISIALFIYVFKNIPITIGVFLTAYAIAFITQYVMSYVLHKRN